MKKAGAGRLLKETLVDQNKPSGMQGEDIDGGSHGQGEEKTREI